MKREIEKAQFAERREFRVTRNDSRTPDVSKRQGYYVKAHDAWQAAEIMSAKYPDAVTGDNDWTVKVEQDGPGLFHQTLYTRDFAIQLWK